MRSPAGMGMHPRRDCTVRLSGYRLNPPGCLGLGPAAPGRIMGMRRVKRWWLESDASLPALCILGLTQSGSLCTAKSELRLIHKSLSVIPVRAWEDTPMASPKSAPQPGKHCCPAGVCSTVAGNQESSAEEPHYLCFHIWTYPCL